MSSSLSSSTLTSSSSASITPTTTFSLPSQSSILDDSISGRISYLSSTTTSLVTCLTLMIALMYLVVLSWAYRYAQKNPRPINKTSGVWVQRYAPIVYAFLVLSSLMEVAFSSWLILQYRFNHNYPNVQTRDGARLLLFASSWTSLTAGAYTLLFGHPTWSKHPVSSVGAQAIWIFVTWLFWVVGAGIVNSSVPSLLDKGTCESVVYCAQIRGLFGVAVIESLTLSGGMLVMLWLAWQSARYALEPVSFPMQ